MPSRALGIILARAGSKGLPNKNALKVAGKPMLAWTIEHALASHRLDRVLVSTDGPKLAEIARPYDVQVVLRPDELASDTATVDAAARHAVNQIVGLHQHLAILYGNVPVRPADLTDHALAKLNETGCDSVQSVYPVEKNHPFWMKRVEPESGRLDMFVDNDIYRRQDLPPVYMLDGGVIALTRDALFSFEPGRPHAFLGKDRRAVVTQPGEVVDVDSETDRLVAETILQRHEHQPGVRAVG
ncbi:MAG: acylneuraminate cytidylyltransferase family protein [Planctomycetota bacterium]